jgi:hypothetical protein
MCVDLLLRLGLNTLSSTIQLTCHCDCIYFLRSSRLMPIYIAPPFVGNAIDLITCVLCLPLDRNSELPNKIFGRYKI